MHFLGCAGPRRMHLGSECVWLNTLRFSSAVPGKAGGDATLICSERGSKKNQKTFLLFSSMTGVANLIYFKLTLTLTVVMFVDLVFLCAVMSWVCKSKKKTAVKVMICPKCAGLCNLFFFFPPSSSQKMRGVRRRSLWKQRAVSVKDKMSARTPSVPTAGIMGAGNEMMKEAERMRRRVILPCWRSERGLAEKLKRSDWCPPTQFTPGVSTWWKRDVYITPKQQTTFGRRMRW